MTWQCQLGLTVGGCSIGNWEAFTGVALGWGIGFSTLYLIESFLFKPPHDLQDMHLNLTKHRRFYKQNNQLPLGVDVIKKVEDSAIEGKMN